MNPPGKAGTPHLAILDGLRGLAAVCVVLFHLTVRPTSLVPVPSLEGILGHAYLAVDFFFLLSGFVIAHAYEKRLLAGFGFANFCRARLVRLYPMFIVGMLIGAFGAWAQPGPAPLTLSLFIRQALFIPLYQHGQFAFPYNLPAWSLMFELLINLFYAGFIPWFTSTLLLGIIGFSALLLGGCGLWHSGINFGGGYPGLPLGMMRTALSFFEGVLIFRAFHYQSIPKLVAHPAAVFLALGVLLAIPAGPGVIGDVYDMFCVLIGFPILIVFCLHISTTNLFMRISGDISYPLYVLHFPLLSLVTTWLAIDPDTPPELLWLYVVLLTVFVLVVSWIFLKFYDEPVRRRLRPSNRPVPIAASAP